MIRSLKHTHVFLVNKSPLYIAARISLTVLLAGSALGFLRASAFNYTIVALYGALGLIYIVYNLITTDYSEEFARILIISQLAMELLIEGLLVNHVGGSFSPFVLFFVISIIFSALYFHLPGSITVATLAGLLYSLPIFMDLSFIYENLIEPPRLAGTGMSSDEAFYSVFLHLCLFYFFAFISGYMAQRLSATSIELKRLRLETGEILEQMRSGLLTVDKDGSIVYFNRSAGIILNADPIAARGKSLREVFGSNQAEFQQRIESALENNKAEDRSEISIIGSDGRVVPLGLSLSIIRDDTKETRGIIAVFQDLSEAKKLEERMRTSDRLAAVGQLAASIAHEIRNPLASISGSVEVLKDELEPQDENLRLMELILKETSRLNTILSDFLNFARAEKGGGGKCDLAAIVPEVVELIRGNADIGDKVHIRYSLHKPTVTIIGSEGQIRQILWNLILNSAQALNETGGEVMVSSEEYSGNKQGDMIKLVVSDNGPGISSSIQSKIFDPFYSTKQGGTGLGLSIVARIIDHLGGRIEYESPVAGGSRFSIYLPIQAVESKAVELQEVM